MVLKMILQVGLTFASKKIPLWSPLTLLTGSNYPTNSTDCKVDLNKIPLFLEEKIGAEKILRCPTPLTAEFEATKILADLALDELLETKLTELRLQTLANLGWIEDMEITTSRMAEEVVRMKEQMESMLASMPSKAMLAALPPQELLATLVASPQLSKLISSLNIIMEEMSVMMADTGMEVEFQQLKDLMKEISSLPAFTVDETSVASIFKDWSFVASSLIEILSLSPATISSLALQSISPAPLVLLSLRSSALVSTLCRQEHPHIQSLIYQNLLIQWANMTNLA